jgi:phospholipase/carboxylesterase
MQLAIESLPAQGRPEQLVLLLHGWAADGHSMSPLADALRDEFPQAALIAPHAPQANDSGRRRGRMWYSIDGLTPEIWSQRVAAALPGLAAWVRAQQQRLAIDAAATCLAGFSQGAILSLELTARDDGIAGRVLAFGGRYVAPLLTAPKLTTVHLLHGSADTVIPVDGSRAAIGQLGALHGDATIDIAEGVGHELHPALIDCAVFRLRNHIPQRTWLAALGAADAARGPAADSA